MRAYERFMNYIQFDTASDANSTTCPSTPGQMELAKALGYEIRWEKVRDLRD